LVTFLDLRISQHTEGDQEIFVWMNNFEN